MNKKGIFLSMMVIVFVIAVSLAGTLAWFTASADAPENVFTAGTVNIEAGEKYVINEEKKGNVNPGDCFVKCFEIENDGSKDIELRLTGFTGSWEWYDGDGESWNNNWLYNNWESLYPDTDKPGNKGVFDDFVAGLGDPVYIAPVPGSDWVMSESDGVYDFYYKGGAIPGTNSTEDNTEAPYDVDRYVRLCVLVIFDGDQMENGFQGANFTLNGEFEAIQASNEAPETAWWADMSDPSWEDWIGMSDAKALEAGTNTAYAQYFYEDLNEDTSFKYHGCMAKGQYFVGFEDKDDFDFDYNDFGMSFALSEVEDDGALKMINMHFTAIVKEAGNTHEITLERLGLPENNGEIGYSYKISRFYLNDPDGDYDDTPAGTYHSSDKALEDVILFDTSRYGKDTESPANGKLYDWLHITLVLDEPVNVGTIAAPRLDGSDLEERLYPYNFKLQNIEGGNGPFDMSNTKPVAAISNAEVPYIVAIPQPGFIPTEDQARMDEAYPDFAEFYKNGSPSNWYETEINKDKLHPAWQ